MDRARGGYPSVIARLSLRGLPLPLSLRGPRKWPVAICGPPHFCHCEALSRAEAISLLGFLILVRMVFRYQRLLRRASGTPRNDRWGVVWFPTTRDCFVRAKYTLPRNDSEERMTVRYQRLPRRDKNRPSSQ